MSRSPQDFWATVENQQARAHREGMEREAAAAEHYRQLQLTLARADAIRAEGQAKLVAARGEHIDAELAILAEENRVTMVRTAAWAFVGLAMALAFAVVGTMAVSP